MLPGTSRGENRKYLKPPPRLCFISSIVLGNTSCLASPYWQPAGATADVRWHEHVGWVFWSFFRTNYRVLTDQQKYVYIDLKTQNKITNMCIKHEKQWCCTFSIWKKIIKWTVDKGMYILMKIQTAQKVYKEQIINTYLYVCIAHGPQRLVLRTMYCRYCHQQTYRIKQQIWYKQTTGNPPATTKWEEQVRIFRA